MDALVFGTYNRETCINALYQNKYGELIMGLMAEGNIAQLKYLFLKMLLRVPTAVCIIEALCQLNIIN